MQLPIELRRAIESETALFDRKQLAKASADLTSAYRNGDFSSASLHSDAAHAAYLIARLPATYAANRRVLQELRARAPHAEVKSLLDLGAGPSVSAWAAMESFALEDVSLLERNPEWLKIGQRLAGYVAGSALSNATWTEGNFSSAFKVDTHDLVIFSYSIGEIEPSLRNVVLSAALKLANQFLIIIEPGTPEGFERIAEARNVFISSGIHLVAPCPHEEECPMWKSGDWCHFSERVERTAEHRALKGGELSYEDEKFSYLIVSRNPIKKAGSRIVRHPMKHSGHVQLSLCVDGRIEPRTITRSQKEFYKAARHSDWGDAWSSEP